MRRQPFSVAGDVRVHDFAREAPYRLPVRIDPAVTGPCHEKTASLCGECGFCDWGTRIRTQRNSELAGAKTENDTQKDTQDLLDADEALREVVATWGQLSGPMRAAVLSMVRAARGA